MRQKSKGFFPFHFSFLICHFFNFLISHLSFLIFKSFSFVIFLLSHLSFVISHFFIREREGDPCIDAQQDDEQGLDGVDNQHEEQSIV